MYRSLPIKLARHLALVAILFLLASAPTHAQSSNAVSDLLARINRERITRGLHPYALNAQLTTAAQTQANDMVRSGKFDHIGSDGSTAVDRAARAGYGAYSWGRRIGENWAHYRDPATAMGMWMDSAPHRGNILHPLYREIGIGATPAEYGFVYVLVFGAQPNVLPVFINDGASATNDANVRITLTTEDVASAGDSAKVIGKPTEAQISNDADFAGATWQPFASQIKWTLSSGNGTKTVYVKYRDAKGRVTTASCSIVVGASNSAVSSARAPVSQTDPTKTRESSPTPTLRATPTVTRPRPSATITLILMPTATDTLTPTLAPTDTPTATATITPTEIVVTPTPTQVAATMTPTNVPPAAQASAAELPDPFALGAFGIGVMLSVLAIVNRLADKK
ncbi:hypothetical protein ANRL1_03338 [Anaerolineae bacterium]|nr:hypothetical protein ANRL1_03338 [Anaerolineae bacterium]